MKSHEFEIPNTAQGLIDKIDEAKESKKRQKTKQEIAEQVTRISSRLIERAVKMGPGIHKREEDGMYSRFVLLHNESMNREPTSKSLSLALDTYRGTETRQIEVGMGKNKGQTEVGWTNGPGSIYDSDGQSINYGIKNKRFRKPEVNVSTSEYEAGTLGGHDPITREADSFDMAKTAKTLSEVRGSLSEKAIEVESATHQ